MADVEIPNPEEIAEKSKDFFNKVAALTVACYAVVLAVAALGGNNAMKDANLYQQQASNQWAYYQAKVIREHLNRTEKLRLEFDLAGLPESNRAAGAKLLAIFANEEARMIADKKDIMKDAKKHEAERDVALRKDPYFDYAEVLLQIAIVIASVSMLANSRLVFVFSIVLALGGAFLTYNGYTLKFALPFLEGKEHVPDAIARLGQWWV